MKRLIFLFGIVLVFVIGAQAQTGTFTMQDGTPVTLWNDADANDSIAADEASGVVMRAKWPGTWSLTVNTDQESGTADGYIILQGSNDGLNWTSTGDTITLAGAGTLGMSGTSLPYAFYRGYYDEQTTAVVSLIVTFLPRKVAQ